MSVIHGLFIEEFLEIFFCSESLSEIICLWEFSNMKTSSFDWTVWSPIRSILYTMKPLQSCWIWFNPYSQVGYFTISSKIHLLPVVSTAA